MKESSERKGKTDPELWTGYGAPALIFFLALLLRSIFYIQLSDTPFFSNLFSDSRIYSQLALGSGAGSGSAYFMSPLYPAFLSSIQALTGDFLTGMRQFQIVAGSLNAVLIYALGRRLFSNTAGIASGILAAVYPLFIFYDSSILIESLQTLYVSAFLLFLLRYIETGSRKDAALWALFFGLMIVGRASIALFVPVLAVVFYRMDGGWKNRSGSLALSGIVLILCVLPWTLHNYNAEGVFAPVTVSGGFNYYAGNNEQTQGTYTVPEPVNLYEDPNGNRYVSRVVGRPLNSAEVSSWWFDRSWRWIKAHPVDYLVLNIRKLLLFFHPGENDQLGLSPDFFRQEYSTVLNAPLPGFAVIFLLAAGGMVIAIRERKRVSLPLLFMVTYVVSIALFFVNGRLRVPLTPVFILFAGYFIERLYAMFRQRGLSRHTYAVVGGLVIAALILFIQPAEQMNYALEYNKLGEIAFDRRQYETAERQFSSSLEEKITPDGLCNLANTFAATERYDLAGKGYRQALEIDSMFMLAWFNLGNLSMQRGRPGAAYGFWKRTVELNPDFAPARRNLGLLLMQAGRLTEAMTQLEHHQRLERDAGKRAEIDRDIARIRQMLLNVR